ncbi:hypothetical protein OQH61_05720 [Helicobacter sp. MIT 21-1697]|uniref:hypothetical protein n=1 Tax=Helicobacter sp. MIT 21-1697 TaxID=2993733 RepID=UPI00224AF44F|nr:hypothetical protein [Helicobacter sp. MIT 21-1697]MCX2717232.1 hypothetical protein [Helicobacter sp. MIT 21-1697]
MKSIAYIVCIACCFCLWKGCATYKLEVENVSLYHEGVQIIDSIKPKSKVRLEVGQSLVGGSSAIPLALFISVQNLDSQNVIFDKDCVQMYQNDKVINPLSDNELKSTSFNYGFIIESYHLYMPPKPISENQLVGMPFIYRGYMGGFYVYDYAIVSARERLWQQMHLDDERAKKALIISSMMQKNTLLPHKAPQGGFIIYAPEKLQKGVLDIYVRVGEEKHRFALQLSKTK